MRLKEHWSDLLDLLSINTKASTILGHKLGKMTRDTSESMYRLLVQHVSGGFFAYSLSVENTGPNLAITAIKFVPDAVSLTPVEHTVMLDMPKDRRLKDSVLGRRYGLMFAMLCGFTPQGMAAFPSAILPVHRRKISTGLAYGGESACLNSSSLALKSLPDLLPKNYLRLQEYKEAPLYAYYSACS